MKTELIQAILLADRKGVDLAEYIACELDEIEAICQQMNDQAAERLKRQNEWVMAQKGIEKQEQMIRARCKHWTRTPRATGGFDLVFCDQCGQEL